MTFADLNRNHPSVIASRIADSDAELVDIPNEPGDKSVSIANGFPVAYSTPYGEGGQPLKRHELNGVLNLLSQLHFYWQAGGSPMWSRKVADTIGGYPKFARVFVETGDGLVEYESVRDNNGVDPSDGNTAYWKEVASGGGGSVDLPEGIATKIYVNTTIDNALSGYATETYVDNALSGYDMNEALSGYATETYVNNALSDYAKNATLSGYVVEAIDNALSGYATETYVREQIRAAITGGGSGGDLPDGVATETYVNTAIDNALSSIMQRITALENVGWFKNEPQ